MRCPGRYWTVGLAGPYRAPAFHARALCECQELVGAAPVDAGAPERLQLAHPIGRVKSGVAWLAACSRERQDLIADLNFELNSSGPRCVMSPQVRSLRAKSILNVCFPAAVGIERATC